MSGKKEEGGFFRFLYNKDTGEVMGRTGSSWAKIIVFYIIFYAGLAAFFGLMLYIFYLTLDVNQPKYQEDNGLIGTNPGVGFRPQPDQDSNVDSTLIWFKKSQVEEYSFWSSQLTTYVKLAQTGVEKTKNCDFGKGNGATQFQACKVDTLNLGPCTETNKFGYNHGDPCVLIKLNRIFGWRPQMFGDNKGAFDMASFTNAIEKKVTDSGMPQELASYIKTNVEKQPDDDAKKNFASSVWISCTGENPADRENLGQIVYYPMPGIPSYYFPYKKQDQYKSPFIMVHFSRVTTGVLVNIECKAWAANIFPDRTTRTGSVHFEMMVDN